MPDTGPSVYFLMAFHCHQPVGNFGFVYDQAFRQAYDPFVTLLERHPSVRVALHYSGSLLDWMEEHQPAFVTRLRRLVRRRQVELLASGYYEPITPMIPEADRQGQIAWMRRALRERFGEEATGYWLTERVWEPDVPNTLASAGIRHTLLDTSQFQSAKALLPPALQVQDEQGWDLLGCYTTECAGSSVCVFPMSKRLRYWIPFQEVARTIEWFRGLARPTPVAVTYADDGEKFGLWPKTHAWVYEQGWLERFFTALERESSWLRTTTFAEYRDTVGPSGRVYVPSGSYDEMLEWSGGSFRNFFVKYPEANAMYQKMLGVSRRLQTLQTSDLRHQTSAKQNIKNQDRTARLTEAQRELYMAQCNDAYWHGVFGGLYLAHLRHAVYGHLLRAEQLLHEASGAWPRAPMADDVDGDGRAEIVITQPTVQLVIDPQEGGAITEWSLWHPPVNLQDTVTRRAEPYHEKLRAKHLALVAGTGTTPSSIHEGLKTKEEGLEAHLIYDDHQRSSFLDYGLASMPTLQSIQLGTWAEHQLWSQGAWEVMAAPHAHATPRFSTTLRRQFSRGRGTKVITVDARAPRVEVAYQVEDVDSAVIALEFNLGLTDEAWATPVWHAQQDRIDLADPHQGVGVAIRVTPAATLAAFPLETVSDSEEGLERTPQGLALVCLWPLDGARRWSCHMVWELRAL